MKEKAIEELIQAESGGPAGAAKSDRGRNRILVYNTSFFDVSQTFIYRQVKSLEDLGEVHLLSSRFLNPHGYSMDVYKRHVARKNRGLTGRLMGKVLKRSFFDTRSFFALHNLFRKHDFDAVHVHFGTNALDILPYAKRYRVPMVVSFHGADASRMVRFPHYTRRLTGLFDYASAIIISGKHMEDTLGLQPWLDKVHLVVYGVEPDLTGIMRTHGRGEKIRILHSGRLTGKKGVPDLIRVFNEVASRHNDVELHIAGDGEEMPQCRELVNVHGLGERVVFYGAVSHERVFQLLRDADIFVLNSRTADDGDMEGTPVTLLEAMAMGKAIVTTRHAGIPGVIDHGINGLLADEKSDEQVIHSLEKLILDPEYRNLLGENARAAINSGYTTDIMKQKLLNVFEAVLNRNNR